MCARFSFSAILKDDIGKSCEKTFQNVSFHRKPENELRAMSPIENRSNQQWKWYCRTFPMLRSEDFPNFASAHLCWCTEKRARGCDAAKAKNIHYKFYVHVHEKNVKRIRCALDNFPLTTTHTKIYTHTQSFAASCSVSATNTVNRYSQPDI